MLKYVKIILTVIYYYFYYFTVYSTMKILRPIRLTSRLYKK